MQNKIKKLACVRKVGRQTVSFQNPKNAEKLAVLEKFLESKQFDETQKDISELVKKNLYWNDPEIGDDGFIDEIQLLNHKYYDRMHYLIERQKFLYKLNYRE